MHKNNPCWLWLPLVMWGGSVNAADFQTSIKNTDMSSVTVGQLESIQQKNMLLEAQVQTARLQRQLRENGLGALPVDGNVTSPGQENTHKAGSATSSYRGATLQLEEIYGRSHSLLARLRLTAGGVVEVRQGDRLPGSSLKVTAITDSVVKLSDGTVMSF
ncbi:type IV pilus biogenesis protein PilP [Yersinia enterocolitica]|uniref:Type IV pilus protein n=1 Tax=Yersinia enterocolitica serotype O:8 / biotype 1B (strain NCTC 13174 / 8081) TaxID=393305 RepID=A1JQ43_YERE8|nr:type IV pilus biogenesis protein PilP [Yersinia enterocolitica]AJJ22369.1 type IV pilus biogenesis family protein [Yersinia enterocolitica]CAL13525.1 putative type IV pilus protein [Yersinia enterocolitica subsp. enterocolitica 8081]CRY25034.1 putative type IV pilus protein [Yersinia enterocolitica]HDL8281351.1 type IV pilus biogenesis protein PilP [Yersinia enterocolitica]